MADISPVPVNLGKPLELQRFMVAASTTIKAGDPVILWTVSGIQRLKVVTATEYANWYATGSTVGGLLGIAAEDCTTDANGLALSGIVPSNVNAGNVPVTALPQYASAFPDKNNSGIATCGVWIANDDTLFKIRITTAGAAITADKTYENTRAGLVLLSSVWSADVSTSNLCVIRKVLEMDQNYNTSTALCHALIQVLPAYQQIKTGYDYT